jgi:gamma-glutamylputrescine oxidase
MSDTDRDDASPYWLREIGPDAPPALPTLPAESDVVVIGGGLMGVSTAYWLARLGVEVLLIEARGLSSGATGRNAGLMLAGGSPLEARSLTRAVLMEEGIEADYETPGHLALAGSRDIWNRIRAEVASRKNVPPTLYALSLKECEELLGMRLAKHFWGGRWLPDGGTIHSTRFVYGIATAAVRRGARLATKTRAAAVTQEPAGLIVRTSRGDVRAGCVVYACNAWVSELLPEFEKVILPVRGQVFSTKPLPRMFRCGLALDWGTVYWRQLTDGAIILGGRYKTAEADTGRDEVVRECIQRRLESFLGETFPDFPAFEVDRRWAGIMDCTPDGKPIVGRLKGRTNRWVVVGFNGHGMPAGLGVGKALAAAIDTGQTPEALRPFDPSRFEGLGDG